MERYSTILISIRPKYVKSIFDFTKKYEYRKKIAKNVKKLIIYETAPTKKVVGEAEVVLTIGIKPERLWQLTKRYSGITKEYFDSYFANKPIAYAYKLGVIKRYNNPRSLAQFHIKVAPQSYIYI